MSRLSQQSLWKVWGDLVKAARLSVERKQSDDEETKAIGILRDLVNGFMHCVMKRMQTEVRDKPYARLAYAVSISTVIKNGGRHALAASHVRGLAIFMVKEIQRLDVVDRPRMLEERRACRHQHHPHHHHNQHVHEDDGGEFSEDEEEDLEYENEDCIATYTMLRRSCTDVVVALKVHDEDTFVFAALPEFMGLVRVNLQPERSEDSRCMALYVAEEMVEHFGEHTLSYWRTGGTIKLSLDAVNDASPRVRRAACAFVRTAATYKAFAPAAAMSCQKLVQVLHRVGARPKRRGNRPGNKEAVTQAVRALDYAVSALGVLMEVHGSALGKQASLLRILRICDRVSGTSLSAAVHTTLLFSHL